MKQLSAIICLTVCLCACQKTTEVEKYDKKNPQADVLTRNGIDSVLGLFEKRKYLELSEEYRKYSDPDKKFDKELSGRDFYVITGKKIYTKVVGNFRVKDFLAKDDYYDQNLENINLQSEQYWLIDPAVLYMMLEMIHRLDEMGHNMYGFHLKSSHRHPFKNSRVSGASYSQHMFGRAIDISVDDVNEDGKEDQADKAILYELLQDIVDDEGGLGLYPGTMSLHLDSRGFRARWDWP